jgi:hypothetical protein
MNTIYIDPCVLETYSAQELPKLIGADDDVEFIISDTTLEEICRAKEVSTRELKAGNLSGVKIRYCMFKDQPQTDIQDYPLVTAEELDFSYYDESGSPDEREMETIERILQRSFLGVYDENDFSNLATFIRSSAPDSIHYSDDFLESFKKDYQELTEAISDGASRRFDNIDLTKIIFHLTSLPDSPLSKVLSEVLGPLPMPDQITYLSNLLHMLGFERDQKFRKSQRVRSIYNDRQHLKNASNFQYLVTCDKKLHAKACAIYSYLGISTKPVLLKQKRNS